MTTWHKGVIDGALIREYDAWVAYESGAGENTMTRDRWERSRALRRPAANSRGRCVVDALRTATRLAGIQDLCSPARFHVFSVVTKRPTTNIMREDAASLINLCNREQKQAGIPPIAFVGENASSILKTTKSKFVDHQPGCVPVLRNQLFGCSALF